MQPKLESFGLAGSVPSSSLASTYDVEVVGDVATCGCRHAQRFGGVMKGIAAWCQHASKLKMMGLHGALVDFYESREDASPDGPWQDLEEVTRAVLASSSDADRVARILLMEAYVHGHVTADDVHRCLDVPLSGDSRVIGAATRGLLTKAWIRKTGYKSSSRTTVNHGRPVGVYELTAEGRKVVEAKLYERFQYSVASVVVEGVEAGV